MPPTRKQQETAAGRLRQVLSESGSITVVSEPALVNIDGSDSELFDVDPPGNSNVLRVISLISRQ